MLPYVQYKEEIHSFSPRISLFIDVISDKQADLLKEKAFPVVRIKLITNNVYMLRYTCKYTCIANWLYWGQIEKQLGI